MNVIAQPDTRPDAFFYFSFVPRPALPAFKPERERIFFARNLCEEFSWISPTNDKAIRVKTDFDILIKLQVDRQTVDDWS